MNFLVIATFVSCYLASYIAKDLNLVSVYFVVLPELIAGLVLLAVFARLMAGKRLQLDPSYLVFLALLLLTMAMGIVAQSVPSGAVVTGLRHYLPFIPLLLLGAIYPFTSRQIKAQLVVLGALLMIQVPISVYQRFFAFSHKMHTGDVVTGTTGSSGGLSIVMVSGVTVLTVLYLRRRLSLPALLLLTAFLLVPTMLNETKSTIAMLPVAMLAPIFFMRNTQKPMKRLLPLIAIFSASGVVFTAVYNSLIENRRYGHSIQEFFLEGEVQTYLYRGTVSEGGEKIGRLDSIQFAMHHISESPMKAAFGLGIGNVSPAQLPGFGGEYQHYYDAYGVSYTQLSLLLWNLGYVGAAVFALLLFAMFRDAVRLAGAGGDAAMLGQIWAPIVMIAAMCVFYKAIIDLAAVIYPLMFYADVVARRAHLLRQEQRVRRKRPAESRWQPA